MFNFFLIFLCIIKKNHMQSNNANDLIIYIFEIIWDYIIVIILTKIYYRYQIKIFYKNYLHWFKKFYKNLIYNHGKIKLYMYCIICIIYVNLFQI